MSPGVLLWAIFRTAKIHPETQLSPVDGGHYSKAARMALTDATRETIKLVLGGSPLGWPLLLLTLFGWSLIVTRTLCRGSEWFVEEQTVIAHGGAG